VLSSSPAALDLFVWLSYRCFTAKGRERVPLFGDFGLVSQLGSVEYARPRKFREKLEGRLDLVRTMWPQCPAAIDANGYRSVRGSGECDHSAAEAGGIVSSDCAIGVRSYYPVSGFGFW
jgi:hypothetical protein